MRKMFSEKFFGLNFLMPFIEDCVFQTPEVGRLGGFNEYVICGVLSQVHSKDRCQCKWIKWN